MYVRTYALYVCTVCTYVYVLTINIYIALYALYTLYALYVCMLYIQYVCVCVCVHLLPPAPSLQCLHDVPAVREAAAEALGTALKVVGERGMAAYLDGLESIKMTKVRSCDHHVIVGREIM